MMPELTRNASGKPNPVPSDFSAVAFVEAASVDADLWPEADLLSFLRYCRGSKRVFLPAALKQAFPRRA